MCKRRMYEKDSLDKSVRDMAFEEDCIKMITFLDHSDQDVVNETRVLYDLEPLK